MSKVLVCLCLFLSFVLSEARAALIHYDLWNPATPLPLFDGTLGALTKASVGIVDDGDYFAYYKAESPGPYGDLASVYMNNMPSLSLYYNLQIQNSLSGDRSIELHSLDVSWLDGYYNGNISGNLANAAFMFSVGAQWAWESDGNQPFTPAYWADVDSSLYQFLTYQPADIGFSCFTNVIWPEYLIDDLGNVYSYTGEQLPNVFLELTYEYTPVPEPSTWLLLGAGLAYVVSSRLWKNANLHKKNG